jgi:hypothetical protein
MAPPTLAQSAISSTLGVVIGVVIGVDTHKDIHVAVALAPNGGRLGECRIPTSRKGDGELIGWTEQFGYSSLFALEGTGSFGAGLCRQLVDAGFPVVEVNRPDRSTRRRLGKDDSIDAEAAARSWISGTATVIPKSGCEKVEMIRLQKCAQDSATESRTHPSDQPDHGDSGNGTSSAAGTPGAHAPQRPDFGLCRSPTRPAPRPNSRCPSRQCPAPTPLAGAKSRCRLIQPPWPAPRPCP